MDHLEITDILESGYADIKRFNTDDAWEQIILRLKADNPCFKE